MAAPTQTPAVADGRETALPAVRRRRHRKDWGGLLARLACAVLAVVGLLPVATTLIVRSTWARTWAARETERVLHDEGIAAHYTMALHAWPLAIELDGVRVGATDGGSPVLAADRVRLRPRLFALLAGKIAVDQIELDAPRVRAVVRDGRLVNLALPTTKSSSPAKWPTRAPFNEFALTDAALDLTIDDIRAEAQSVDLDVTAEDDIGAEGTAFEVALRVGKAAVHRPRVAKTGGTAIDDDALCSVEGRVRLEPKQVIVRRLEGVGSADLDGAADTTPPCDLPADDKRRVEVSLGHLHVVLPTESSPRPVVDGHVRVRAPIALAERLVKLPETDGWVALESDVRYGATDVLPELDNASLDAHDVRVKVFAFAQAFHSDFVVQQNLVKSAVSTLHLGDGVVTLLDTQINPLAEGGPHLDKTHLDIANVNFTTLLRNLGVHPHAWVGWDIREVHTTVISGGLAPLKLDGDLSAKTYSFGAYDRPAEDKTRERLFGLAEAQILSHLSVRPEGVKFADVRIALPHSRIEGGFVSLGFNNDLKVDVQRVSADLDDVSPIGPVTLKGHAELSAHIGGNFGHPTPEGDIHSITGLIVSDLAFGDLTGGHFKVDVEGPGVDIAGVHAKRRDSPYEIPTATLHFENGFAIDAVGQSPAFRLPDLLSMFALEDDPRYAGIDATIATRADVHVALGGPEDACGGGYVAVTAKSHLADVALYGEKFAQGDADVAVRWYDRERGIAGADLDVRSFVLEKVLPPKGTRAAATGTVLGSASMRRGGALAANVMIENVPLGRIDSLGAVASDLDGALSGVAHVTGNLDDSRPDASLIATMQVDAAGTRFRQVAFPPSHLDVRLTQRFPQQRDTGARTKCNAPISPLFDKAAFLADTASHGEWTIDGDLLGQTVKLTDVVVTRAKAPNVTGRLSLRGLDLGALARVGAARTSDGDETAQPISSAISGQLWADIIADDIPTQDLSKAHVRVQLGPTVVSRGGQKLTLRPPATPIVIADDAISMPPLEVTLDTPEGFQGGFVLTGGATKVTSDPTLDFDARLKPVDLAILQRLVPKIDRVAGSVEGDVRVTGRAAAPAIAGELHAKADDIEVHDLPGAITDVSVDLRATSTDLTGSGQAKFAGGIVSFDAALPIRGLDVGALESHIKARSVHVTPAEGINATFDADLEVEYDKKGQGAEAAALPRVTGDVFVGSFDYTRPISLTTDLSQLGTRAKRTEVNSYDPSLDFVSFDIRVQSRAPVVIKNNLVEVQLAIDSGSLEVTGTNQRIGLRGSLKTLPGGRFHFQSSEFDVRQGLIRFDDPTRIDPNVDITAVTEYRRYTDTSAGAAAGAGAGAGPAAASTGSGRGGSLWRITLHAYGDADNLRVDMTSEPSLSQEDIVLLLAVGMTRAELDQLQASSIGASIALNYLGAASGADRAVKQALPVIDDFRFGSAYSTVTGKTEPQLTIGKRLTNDVRASVTAGLSEDRELRSNIEWRLNNRLSVQGSYDNITDVSSSALGNLGVDLRWRLEFE